MKCGHVYKVNDITLVVNKGYSSCNVMCLMCLMYSFLVNTNSGRGSKWCQCDWLRKVSQRRWYKDTRNGGTIHRTTANETSILLLFDYNT